MEQYLQCKGVDASKCGSIPHWLAKGLSWVGFVPGAFVKLMGEEVTVSDLKARNDLGYKELYSFEDGIKETKEYYQNVKGDPKK